MLEVITKLYEEENSSKFQFKLFNLYRGFSLELLSSIIYWTITFTNFDRLNNYFIRKKEKYGKNYEYLPFHKKMFLLFGAITVNNIIASSLIYPIDTYKRYLQVNGGLGFTQDYITIKEKLNITEVRNMYR